MTSGLLLYHIIYFLTKDILMGNKIVLISSYCNTEEKIKVLSNNIDKLKSIGLDVMLNSPIPLPNELTNKCDFYFLNKENPVLNWPTKSSTVWWAVNSNGTEILLTRAQPDYGWANIFQVKTLSEISLNFEYEYYYHIIYDLNITDSVLNHLKSDKKCNFFHFHEWGVSLHLILFDKENLKTFVSNISLDQYLSFGDIAETWLMDYIQKFLPNHLIEDEYVDEHIHFYEGVDLFNYSPINGVRFFIIKDGQTSKILFYSIDKPINIICDFGNVSFGKEYDNLDTIDVTGQDTIVLTYEDCKYNVSEIIKSVTYNTFSLI